MNECAHSPAELHEICRKYFRDYWRHNPLTLIILTGPPGAGKTTFCQGFADPLGIADTINSPTFNLLNEYTGSRGCLKHSDLYRLAAPGALEELGLLDSWTQVEKEPTIVAVEWGDRFPFSPGCPVYRITITPLDDESRCVSIEKQNEHGSFDSCN